MNSALLTHNLPAPMQTFTKCDVLQGGYVIVSGDYDGEIKVFYQFSKPKHSSLPESAAATAAATISTAATAAATN